MSDSTGTATGPGGAGGGDDERDDTVAADAVPAGALSASAASSSTPVRTEERRGRIRGIGTFYRQVVAELRKVIWPTRRELVTYTSVVLVFVAIMVAIVSVYDFAFGRVVLEVFGN